MIPVAIPFPDFDPVAISLGPFGPLGPIPEFGPLAVKWYGLAYLAGLVLGWLYIRRLLGQPPLWKNGTPPFSVQMVDDLLIYITVGVVLGGRLGYVFLYEPSAYLASPLDVLAIWKGGMSFHGAFIGCALSMLLFARNYGVSFLSTTDLCTAAAPIGLFFGRLANFTNGELFGRVTDVPWAMVFPHARALHPDVEPATRHPSQLYEAALEGLLLYLVLRLLTHWFGALKSPGLVTGVFLAGYALARSTVEFYREPHFMVGPFTAGQIYSLPMLALGLYLIWLARQQAAAAKP